MEYIFNGPAPAPFTFEPPTATPTSRTNPSNATLLSLVFGHLRASCQSSACGKAGKTIQFRKEIALLQCVMQMIDHVGAAQAAIRATLASLRTAIIGHNHVPAGTRRVDSAPELQHFPQPT
jgi:hypothetical protein